MNRRPTPAALTRRGLDRRALLRWGALMTTVPVITACAGDDGSTGGGSTANAPAGSAAEFPRTVAHELGETNLERLPERIVCGTDGAELCSLLALGLTPIGYGQREDPPAGWFEGRTEGLDSYDLSSGETSYEALAAWAPDVILVQVGFATEETMARFTDVAPTVATSFIDWRDNLRQVAQAVGRDAEAEELEKATDAAVAERADALREELGDLSDFTVRAVASFTDGSVYSFNADSPLGKLCEALGLASLPPAGTPGEAIDQISREQLDLLDGDLLLVMSFDDGPNGNAGLADSGLWKRLDVVRDGGVVQVGPAEANALYFDAIFTVEPNAETIDRLVRERLA
jgi:iron complex transport system substrate-binding protein